MKAFRTVLLCLGTLSVAAAAPVARDNAPQQSEYEYDYESSGQVQAQEPQESASHYDAYIQDVKAAATGDNQKKGFSRGSGLRTIAVGSANQAKTALGNQAAAAYQAAYMAKNTLAQSAAQASATAQAALAGKQVILSGLEQQVRDAKVALQGEEMQLQQAKRAAQSAAQAAQQAMHQVNVIQAALNAAQATSENANEAASQAAGELGAQTAMVGAARQRLQTLQEQLHGVRIDFEATQSAARKAQAAAQQAQANAAAAAAKAAAAGLGQKDSSHEEGSSTQAHYESQTSQQYHPNHEDAELTIDNALENTSLKPIVLDIDPYASKPVHIRPVNTAEIRILPDPSAFNQHKGTKTRTPPTKAFDVDYFGKLNTYQKLTSKPIKLFDADSFDEVFPEDYVDLNRFFRNKGIWAKGINKIQVAKAEPAKEAVEEAEEEEEEEGEEEEEEDCEEEK